MFNVGIADDSLVVEDADEVQVIGQPGKCEHGHHDDEHTDNLHSTISNTIIQV